jgi:hypothetical protein
VEFRRVQCPAGAFVETLAGARRRLRRMRRSLYYRSAAAIRAWRRSWW